MKKPISIRNLNERLEDKMCNHEKHEKHEKRKIKLVIEDGGGCGILFFILILFFVVIEGIFGKTALIIAGFSGILTVLLSMEIKEK